MSAWHGEAKRYSDPNFTFLVSGYNYPVRTGKPIKVRLVCLAILHNKEIVKMNVSREKTLQYIAQGAVVLLVVVAVLAVMEFMKVGELESALSQAQASAGKATQDSALARKKLQDELKTLSAKTADLEQKQRQAEAMKTLLAKVEPQVVAALEAAGKAGKPDARAAALIGAGLIGQIANGTAHAPALAALNRALAIDKANCIAGLAINMSGTNKVEVSPDCQSLLPAPAQAAEAKPAADPPAAPAGAPAKAAAPAGKS